MFMIKRLRPALILSERASPLNRKDEAARASSDYQPGTGRAGVYYHRHSPWYKALLISPPGPESTQDQGRISIRLVTVEADLPDNPEHPEEMDAAFAELGFDGLPAID